VTSRARTIWSIIAGLAVVAIAVFLAILLWPAGPAPQVTSSVATPDLVARGHYIATAADCTACHTAPGQAPFTGGRAFKLPFGTIYSPNITPDRETGIGAWTDGEFLRAVHKGVGRGGKSLYPAFPYTSYTRMTDGDALAIKAYLFSLAPVRHQSPANDLVFPFKSAPADAVLEHPVHAQTRL
jgi:mono/diheme cytochrome c family protein